MLSTFHQKVPFKFTFYYILQCYKSKFYTMGFNKFVVKSRQEVFWDFEMFYHKINKIYHQSVLKINWKFNLQIEELILKLFLSRKLETVLNKKKFWIIYGWPFYQFLLINFKKPLYCISYNTAILPRKFQYHPKISSRISKKKKSSKSNLFIFLILRLSINRKFLKLLNFHSLGNNCPIWK